MKGKQMIFMKLSSAFVLVISDCFARLYSNEIGGTCWVYHLLVLKNGHG